MAVELNLAQVIGYSVQVLLLLALLVALSIRSWPFLIAIVFMALIALVLACMRAIHSPTEIPAAGLHVEEEEVESDPESLDYLRSVRLSHEASPVHDPKYQFYRSPETQFSLHTENTSQMPSTSTYQMVSPYMRQSLATTPDHLANIERQIRWTAQSAPRMHGSVPLASQQVLMQLGRSDVNRPDPNLIPVNPGPRKRDIAMFAPKLSAWSTASYLHKK